MAGLVCHDIINHSLFFRYLHRRRFKEWDVMGVAKHVFSRGHGRYTGASGMASTFHVFMKREKKSKSYGIYLLCF